MNGNQMYKENEKLIQKAVWECSRKYSLIEREEIEGQALEIFCKALLTFDAQRGTKFSTYLFGCLKALNKWCQAEYATRAPETSFDEVAEYVLTYRQTPTAHLEDSIQTELSEEARVVVNAILSGSMVLGTGVNVSKKGLTVTDVQKFLHMDWRKAAKVAAEIRQWWVGFEQEYALA